MSLTFQRGPQPCQAHRIPENCNSCNAQGKTLKQTRHSSAKRTDRQHGLARSTWRAQLPAAVTSGGCRPSLLEHRRQRLVTSAQTLGARLTPSLNDTCLRQRLSYDIYEGCLSCSGLSGRAPAWHTQALGSVPRTV